MAAELIGILDSFIEVPKVALSHPNHQPDPSPTNYGPWMWNPIKQSHTQELDDDDSWEVRAFAEDTGNAMGTTWPPRSYTCTFCRREFRSAQALGGHMNVHRRDRARLHQSQSSNSLGSVIGNFPITSTSTPHPLVIGPNQDFMAGGGLCVVYQIPDQTDGGFIPGPVSSDGSFLDSHSTLLSIISSYNVPPNGSMRNYPCSPDSLDLSTLPPFPVHGQDNYLSHHSEVVTSSSGEITDAKIKNNKNKCNEFKEEQELDLELRLGQSQPPNLS